MSMQDPSPLLLRVGASVVQVRITDARLAAWLARTMADLKSSGGPVSHQVEIVSGPDLTQLIIDGAQYYSSSDQSNVVDHLVSWCNQQAILSQPSMVNLHAAGVCAPNNGVCIVLPGVPGAGKSSVAAAAVSRGWSYLSDEMVSLGPDGVAQPYPKPITVKTGGKGLLDVDYADQTISDRQTRWYLRPAWLGGRVSSPARVHAFVFANFSPEAPTTVAEMSTADAVLELAANCQDELDHSGAALGLLARAAASAVNLRVSQSSIDGAMVILANIADRPSPSPTAVQPLIGPSVEQPQVGPRVATDAVGLVLSDGVVVHQPSTQTLVALDPLAGTIWQLLDGTATEDELATELAQAFDHPPVQVATDVGALLDQLRSHGLVTG